MTPTANTRAVPNRKVHALAAFLRELKSIRGYFTWTIDEFGMIRGQHLITLKPHDPITACVFCGTQRYFRPCDTHLAALELNLQDYSAEIVEAIDNWKETVLRRGILVALELLDR